MCVCACVRARACVRVCVRVCVFNVIAPCSWCVRSLINVKAPRFCLYIYLFILFNCFLFVVFNVFFVCFVCCCHFCFFVLFFVFAPCSWFFDVILQRRSNGDHRGWFYKLSFHCSFQCQLLRQLQRQMDHERRGRHRNVFEK